MEWFLPDYPQRCARPLSKDRRLSAEERKNFADTALVDAQMRKLRVQAANSRLSRHRWD